MNKYYSTKSLGTLRVPAGYVGNRCVDSFRSTYGHRFSRPLSQHWSDQNFACQSFIMEPGMSIEVRIHQKTSTEPMHFMRDRIEYLKTLEKNVFPGVRGLILVWMNNEMREALPELPIVTCDLLESLPNHQGDVHMPSLGMLSGTREWCSHIGWARSEWLGEDELFLSFHI